jgi:alpha-tubulin suppressor-like RCC1 family protein
MQNLFFALVALTWSFGVFGEDVPGVFAAGDYTCIAEHEGCHGSNAFGQLKFASNVPDLKEEDYALGPYHVCLRAKAEIRCFGNNDYGQFIPRDIDLTMVSAGDYHTCGLDSSRRTVFCWGRNDKGQSETRTFDQEVTELVSGSFHNCAITGSEIRCWGDDLHYPPTVNNPHGLTAGSYHNCVIGDGDKIVCWGANTFGQSASKQLNHPKKVVAGQAHTCALDDDGLHCWGDNYYHQLAPPGGRHIVDVTSGKNHLCYVNEYEEYNYGIACWGNNAFDQTNTRR